MLKSKYLNNGLMFVIVKKSILKKVKSRKKLLKFIVHISNMRNYIEPEKIISIIK